MIETIPNILNDHGVQNDIEDKVTRLMNTAHHGFHGNIEECIRYLIREAARWGWAEGFRYGWRIGENKALEQMQRDFQIYKQMEKGDKP